MASLKGKMNEGDFDDLMQEAFGVEKQEPKKEPTVAEMDQDDSLIHDIMESNNEV